MHVRPNSVVSAELNRGLAKRTVLFPELTDAPSRVQAQLSYSNDALSNDLIRVHEAWRESRRRHDRFSVYQYLTAVFDLVTVWENENRAVERAKQALWLKRRAGADKIEPFAAVIRCTSPRKKADAKARSKWARALIFAAEDKLPSASIEYGPRCRIGASLIDCFIQTKPITMSASGCSRPQLSNDGCLVFGTSRTNQPRPRLSPIGVTTGKGPRESDLNFSAIQKSPQGNTLLSRQHDTQHSEFVSCVGGCSMGQDRPLHAVTRGATRDKHARPHAPSCRCHVDDELCERSVSHSAGDLAAQSLS